MATPPPQPPIPPEMLEQLIQAMRAARDGLIQASLLLQDHLFETDTVRREQARAAVEAAIRRAKVR